MLMRSENYRTGCHPVSNDDDSCQAILSDTSPVGAFDFSEAPFRSVRKVLTFQTKVVTLFKSRSGTHGPTIHLFGTCAHDSYFELPASSGRPAAHSNARL